MARYNTEFYEPVVHDYANFGTWTERGSLDANQRATRVWKEIVAADARPEIDQNRLEALKSFVAKRTAEGGAPPES
jgi:trimethylamine--corrinoid protein Co-methyltransferase